MYSVETIHNHSSYYTPPQVGRECTGKQCECYAVEPGQGGTQEVGTVSELHDSDLVHALPIYNLSFLPPTQETSSQRTLELMIAFPP